MTIFKYPLELAAVNELAVPTGATFLAVQMQGIVPCAWALVNPGAKLAKRTLHIVGTGHDVPGGTYIATIQTGRYVWHIFDGGES